MKVKSPREDKLRKRIQETKLCVPTKNVCGKPLVTWDTGVGRGGASGDWTGRNCRQRPVVWGASGGCWSSCGVSWVADVAWPTGWLTASGDGLGSIRTSGRTGVRRVGTGDWPRCIRRGSSSGVGGVADIDWAVGSLTAGRRRNVARRHGGSTCSCVRPIYGRC